MSKMKFFKPAVFLLMTAEFSVVAMLFWNWLAPIFTSGVVNCLQVLGILILCIYYLVISMKDIMEESAKNTGEEVATALVKV